MEQLGRVGLDPGSSRLGEHGHFGDHRLIGKAVHFRAHQPLAVKLPQRRAAALRPQVQGQVTPRGHVQGDAVLKMSV